MTEAELRNQFLAIIDQEFTVEEKQLNAVFALFGHAAQKAQQFEKALEQFLVLYNKVAHTSLTVAELEQKHTELARRTMGQLLREFQKHAKTDKPAVESNFEIALNRRNFLMHHFWKERRSWLDTEDGRADLLIELHVCSEMLTWARNHMSGICIAFEETLNPTRPQDGSDTIYSIQIDIPDKP